MQTVRRSGHASAKTSASFWSRSASGPQPPHLPNFPIDQLTYHEACHLCHGQKITVQPRRILKSIPGVKLTELAESTWCCGSAGIYNIIQPAMSQQLLSRKLGHIAKTGASIVATANPGCHLQIENGAKAKGQKIQVLHPVSLLAMAYARRNRLVRRRRITPSGAHRSSAGAG